MCVVQQLYEMETRDNLKTLSTDQYDGFKKLFSDERAVSRLG
jgi:hypothetical protein